MIEEQAGPFCANPGCPLHHKWSAPNTQCMRTTMMQTSLNLSVKPQNPGARPNYTLVEVYRQKQHMWTCPPGALDYFWVCTECAEHQEFIEAAHAYTESTWKF